MIILQFQGGLLQAPLNPLKTDVSRGPTGLSGGPGPLGSHRNSTTATPYSTAPMLGAGIAPSIRVGVARAPAAPSPLAAHLREIKGCNLTVSPFQTPVDAT